MFLEAVLRRQMTFSNPGSATGSIAEILLEIFHIGVMLVIRDECTCSRPANEEIGKYHAEDCTTALRSRLDSREIGARDERF